jgi:hypothetical protein
VPLRRCLSGPAGSTRHGQGYPPPTPCGWQQVSFCEHVCYAGWLAVVVLAPLQHAAWSHRRGPRSGPPSCCYPYYATATITMCTWFIQDRLLKQGWLRGPWGRLQPQGYAGHYSSSSDPTGSVLSISTWQRPHTRKSGWQKNESTSISFQASFQHQVPSYCAPCCPPFDHTVAFPARNMSFTPEHTPTGTGHRRSPAGPPERWLPVQQPPLDASQAVRSQLSASLPIFQKLEPLPVLHGSSQGVALAQMRALTHAGNHGWGRLARAKK